MIMFRYIVIAPVKKALNEWVFYLYFVLFGAVMMLLFEYLPRDDLIQIKCLAVMIMMTILYFGVVSVVTAILSSLYHGIILIHPQWRKKLIEKVYENDTTPSL